MPTTKMHYKETIIFGWSVVGQVGRREGWQAAASEWPRLCPTSRGGRANRVDGIWERSRTGGRQVGAKGR